MNDKSQSHFDSNEILFSIIDRLLIWSKTIHGYFRVVGSFFRLLFHMTLVLSILLLAHL